MPKINKEAWTCNNCSQNLPNDFKIFRLVGLKIYYIDWTNHSFRICPLYNLGVIIKGKWIIIRKVITIQGRLWVEPVLDILVY